MHDDVILPLACAFVKVFARLRVLGLPGVRHCGRKYRVTALCAICKRGRPTTLSRRLVGPSGRWGDEEVTGKMS